MAVDFRDGDLAAVQSLRPDDLTLLVRFPASGAFFVEASAVMEALGHLRILVNGDVVGEALLGDVPGWNPVSVVGRVQGEPDSVATVTAVLIGTWTEQPLLVVTENPPFRTL